jgi:hypothetical protein
MSAIPIRDRRIPLHITFSFRPFQFIINHNMPYYFMIQPARVDSVRSEIV